MQQLEGDAEASECPESLQMTERYGKDGPVTIVIRDRRKPVDVKVPKSWVRSKDRKELGCSGRGIPYRE